MLLCKIIGYLKMNSSKHIHQEGLNIFQWQRSYYDEIIKNEYSLYYIREYIKNNPINWSSDENNPANFKGNCNTNISQNIV